jgi:hypothetical protein
MPLLDSYWIPNSVILLCRFAHTGWRSVEFSVRFIVHTPVFYSLGAAAVGFPWFFYAYFASPAAIIQSNHIPYRIPHMFPLHGDADVC